MANSYTQAYMHYVFATKHRMRFIHEEHKDELYNYLAGMLKKHNCFLQCIGGMEDHIHLLVGLNPDISIADFAQKVKVGSTKFINDSNWSGWIFNGKKVMQPFLYPKAICLRCGSI